MAFVLLTLDEMCSSKVRSVSNITPKSFSQNMKEVLRVVRHSMKEQGVCVNPE